MEEKGEMVARDGVGHPLLVDGGDGLLDLGHPVVEYKGDRGAGEGDSEKSYGNMETAIIDTVIHNFLGGDEEEQEEQVQVGISVT